MKTLDISGGAEQTILDGFEAYARGMRCRDNPYTANSDRWHWWDRGWHGAEEIDPFRGSKNEDRSLPN
ncbi:hypothetical protein RPMA_12575 [Tardiphaga alba]|uniref:Uncharacterized protein n=1 Tax=Tardiphaga alba TaxID=340268 RepID=A0ABX8A7E8_9BRAD|nr:hypothetical protein [Tardiphaga alba]QUS39579.1 hypothetical protein RPMA_12575 [Tardiphaga alba]